MIKTGYRPVNEDDADSWITVRGQHIPLDADGTPIGGNPKVFGKKDKQVNHINKKSVDSDKSRSNNPTKSKDTEKFSPKPAKKEESILKGLNDLGDAAKDLMGHDRGIGDLIGEITK